MNVFIITGASRGLGRSIAERLFSHNVRLIGLSRTLDTSLDRMAETKGCRLEQISVDLNQPERAAEVLSELIRSLEAESPASVTLINNAGILEPMMPLGEATTDLLSAHLLVNLTAPAAMSSAFIRETQNWEMPKTIVNISSGAGKKPYAGWAAYCTAKAGLDMLTRCIGVEQEGLPHPVRAVSIAPGVVDTGMQERIRGTKPAQFPQVERFIRMKQNGELFSSEYAADWIVRILEEGTFRNGEVIDIRTYAAGMNE
ncbi:(S)-benzoin forming benzil reductase [Paenibacillus filicis]|uniref:(S)-benzoin forming benzil reductase n=1 Tax=Paenibacillus gyeongsangnamensis TaxID=3388067 RepID=A0ABT4QGM4_9BACL|nr:(S)-benzoin forming benzil reductase [Paenibacillus filicis]MCZ8516002.1 (S)-benzoin forming benzil reductase [Paenibacillus filicis]